LRPRREKLHYPGSSGGKNFITLEALKKIERCQILIGSERLLSTFAPSGKKQIVLTGSMENLELTLKEHQTKTVGILVTGDAGLYSLAKKVLTLCECVEIVPGVSSLQAAFARLGQSWDNVETFSFHGSHLTALTAFVRLKRP